MGELGRLVEASIRELGRTSSYHFRASAGMLYCFAFSVRSSTREGKTASKSFFLDSLEDIVDD